MGHQKRYAEISEEDALAAWNHISQADMARGIILKEVVHLLTSRGWTVRQIAGHLGVSKSQVNRIASHKLQNVVPAGKAGDQALEFADRAWQHVGGRPTGLPWGEEL
ncbi:helix-turn-helix domain-containing protein [Paenarthrobacter sp. FR1]|uniref:helix-turn-helix domain-containing protein n=1 Tax=Paenarthrobacter sp. FR1 TaxID=3439548 RepID=UPI003DA24A60